MHCLIIIRVKKYSATQSGVELNITLPRVNNFDIKEKNGMEYLLYYLLYTPNTKQKWVNDSKAQNILVTTQLY